LTPHRAAHLVGLLLAASALAEPPSLSPEIRRYLAEKHFHGISPDDPAIPAACEALVLPGPLRAHVAALEWERGQLERFERDKVFLLVRTPDGVKAMHFRKNWPRNVRTLDARRETALRRLYSAEEFEAAPPPELRRVLERPARTDALAFLREMAEQPCGGLRDVPLDWERIGRNLEAAGERREGLLRALEALWEHEFGRSAIRAGLWLVSRMDTMDFRREGGDGSVRDLDATDARLFYENVRWAVEARERFPWGASVPTRDFLQFVLSPRGTGEPLQRWRRHFFRALEPGLAECRTAAEAIRFATDVAYDFFQYEGDTTWEDFGMLTALAVHEGRCEDCTNVETAMLRAAGIPGVQAFTPWWGAGDGNHAWTWIPAVGEKAREGGHAVKVYVKTWDGLDDVTAEHTPVTTVDVESPAEGDAELCVWNHEEWRRVMRATVKDGRARFENVGCARDFALLVKLPGGASRLLDVRAGGEVRAMSEADGPGEIAVSLPAVPPGVLADPEVRLERWREGAWHSVPAVSVAGGWIHARYDSGRLYRAAYGGRFGRPFVVERGAGGEPAVRLR
jgi:hypothetical protein